MRLDEVTVQDVLDVAFAGAHGSRIVVDDIRGDWQHVAAAFKDMRRAAVDRGRGLKLVLCLSDVLEQRFDKLRIHDFKLSALSLVKYADMVVYRSELDDDVVLKRRNGSLRAE